MSRVGSERVNRALAGLDARDAQASVYIGGDGHRILIRRDIESAVGMEEFNRRVRGGMLAEFKRIATQASMH